MYVQTQVVATLVGMGVEGFWNDDAVFLGGEKERQILVFFSFLGAR